MNTTSPLLTSTLDMKPTIQIPPISNLCEETSKPEKTDSKRCSADKCKKKLSLTDFPCKCGKICCSAHRPAEEHGCTYNYRADYTNLLQSTIGEVVNGKKIDKI